MNCGSESDGNAESHGICLGCVAAFFPQQAEAIIRKLAHQAIPVDPPKAAISEDSNKLVHYPKY